MPTSTTATAVSAASAAAASALNSAAGSQDGPTSRPLLFFVALGFGVVFTNLWIIVGVKYCFRYNQRARQLAALGEDGEGMDMGNMQRPRRRREKKLMSMEEVNERFPLTKYKIWRASREHDGLPAAGGVTAPPSRAASVRERMSVDGRGEVEYLGTPGEMPTRSGAAQQHHPWSEAKDFARTQESRESADGSDLQEKGLATEGASHARNSHEHIHSHASLMDPNDATAPAAEADDEEDPIRTAVPAELLGEPGDACAICLDNLDDDDEVRGLDCGHAFHASCLDPWLTARRACCPLCKADYYVPKPRPERDGISGADSSSRRGGAAQGAEDVAVPGNVWMAGRGFYPRPRLFLAGARFTEFAPREGDQSQLQTQMHSRPRREGQSRAGRLWSSMTSSPARRGLGLRPATAERALSANTPGEMEAPTTMTPSQLEEGVAGGDESR